MRNFVISSSIFVAVLFIGTFIPVQCYAACWCGYDYCIGIGVDPLTITSTITWTSEETLATSSKSIGSCPSPNATPTTKTCDVSGSHGMTHQWQVSGSLSYSYFGVSAQYGAEVALSAGSEGTTTINNWCQCCFERVYAKYANTYMEGSCSCLGPFCSSPAQYSGTKKVFQGVHNTDQPACVVPANCSSDCPPGA